MERAAAPADSCEFGRGHAFRSWGAEAARLVGTTAERSRYRRRYCGRPARESALRQLDPYRETVLTAFPDLDEDLDQWEERLGFPEVPPEYLRGIDWRVSGQGRWKFGLATHLGEACAGQESLEAAISQARCGASQQLTPTRLRCASVGEVGY